MSTPYCACCDPPPCVDDMTPEDVGFMSGAGYLLTIGLTGNEVGDGLCARHAKMLRRALAGVRAGHDRERARARS